MTNAFPVTGKGGSGLCAHIVTQVEPAQPSLLVLQKSPALHQYSSTFSLFCKAPCCLLPFLGWNEMSGHGWEGWKGQFCPPPQSGCECQANCISPATPLSPEPLCRCITGMVLCPARHRLPSSPAMLPWQIR